MSFFSLLRMITSRPKITTANMKSFQRTELIGIEIKYKCYDIFDKELTFPFSIKSIGSLLY